MFTIEDLQWIIDPVPRASRVIEVYPYIEPCCQEFDILTPLRQAMFIAQLAHESGKFQWFEELASGEAYEGRLDLGNEYEGDGVRFKGRGLIQLTGAFNYQKYSDFAYGDKYHLLDNPELVSIMPDAMRCAGWFWWKHNINAAADVANIERATRIINGGYRGLAERKVYYDRAVQVIF